MHNGVFDAGSVIDFKLFEATIEVSFEDEMPSSKMKVVGWGMTVVERDGWVMKMAIQPMTVCGSCCRLVPLEYHFQSVHEVAVRWKLPQQN